MTTGISKEELRKLRDHYFSLGINPVIAINNLIEQCKELNPWLPIDENTPKDRPLWLFNGVKVIGQWDACLCDWYVSPIFWNGLTHDKKLPFTHYQELPEDPE